ncbi:MAG: GPW/gp25 family protein [Bacteroidia bacterium]|nr:GPW/gp25 family protein [Bacteroidia bacterium]
MEQQRNFLGIGWSFPPFFDQTSRQVAMVSDEEDIVQSLFILLSTSPGERPTMPQYGCDLMRVMFKPLDTATQAEARDAIDMAVLYFEPRITLEGVSFDLRDQLDGVIYITLSYTIRKTNVRTNIVYPFYKLEGTNVAGQ